MSNLSQLLARCAVAFCFLSFGIWELIEPASWTGYVPEFIAKFADPVLLVRMHGVVLSIVGLGVLSGFFLSIFAAIAGLMIAQISLELWLQSGFTDIFVRDITILLFIAALHAGSLKSASSKEPHI